MDWDRAVTEVFGGEGEKPSWKDAFANRVPSDRQVIMSVKEEKKSEEEKMREDIDAILSSPENSWAQTLERQNELLKDVPF